ncbi:MAG: SH3 domain-containing protein [Lachnospiraceae bacterium]|nr:SH3 domain-containing protein [Lachnospiraceae bacterium]MDD3660842.1 SH3 domain-containing protein [Lachnospiraceae bacterium]
MKKSKSGIGELLQNLLQLILRGKEWVINNTKTAVFVAVTAVLLVIAIVVAITVGDRDREVQAEISANTVATVKPVSEVVLEENKYPEVNDLITRYYTALADGDMDTVVACRNYTEETEKIRLEKKSQYIDSYQNLKVYTKDGMVENTYLAYVYYEVKFNDIETLAPALNTLYICPNESGELYIYEGEIDDTVSEYLKELSTQDDVVELFNRVEVSYNAATEQDESLRTFLAELPTKIKTEVGEALAAIEEPDSTVSDNSTEQAAATEVSSNEAEITEPVAEQASASTTEIVETTDTVNVRSSDSETADKIGKAPKGERYTRLESKENGWSRIMFEEQEGFIKSDYLKVVETQETAAETVEAEEQTQEAEATQGNVRVKETVNVRNAASETADKLGVAYQGDEFGLIMEQADGWTKIDYKGQTGYIKSEFLE